MRTTGSEFKRRSTYCLEKKRKSGRERVLTARKDEYESWGVASAANEAVRGLSSVGVGRVVSNIQLWQVFTARLHSLAVTISSRRLDCYTTPLPPLLRYSGLDCCSTIQDTRYITKAADVVVA
jgi:hypothetical protein